MIVLVVYHQTSLVLLMFDKKKSFNLSDTFASHKTHETFLHFNHPTRVWWFTFPSISLLFFTINQKYLNDATFCMIWSPTFTSKLEMIHLLLKFYFIYSVFLLLMRNPNVFKDFLKVSNLTSNSSPYSPSRTISSAKSIQLCARSWMCSVSNFKTQMETWGLNVET